MQRLPALLCLTLLLGGVVFLESSLAKDDEVPAAVRKAIKATFPKAKIDLLDTTEMEVEVYEGTLEQDEKDIEVWVTRDGTLVQVLRQLDGHELPQAVQASVTKGGFDVVAAERQEIHAEMRPVKLKSPKVTYEVRVKSGEKRVTYELDAKGKVLSKREHKRRGRRKRRARRDRDDDDDDDDDD